MPLHRKVRLDLTVAIIKVTFELLGVMIYPKTIVIAWLHCTHTQGTAFARAFLRRSSGKSNPRLCSPLIMMYLLLSI